MALSWSLTSAICSLRGVVWRLTVAPKAKLQDAHSHVVAIDTEHAGSDRRDLWFLCCAETTSRNPDIADLTEFIGIQSLSQWRQTVRYKVRQTSLPQTCLNGERARLPKLVNKVTFRETMHGCHRCRNLKLKKRRGCQSTAHAQSKLLC